jgi:hypothetical protein
MSGKSQVVYVIGAGFSAGLGFPLISNLLQELWPRLDPVLANDIAAVARFHHPDFHPLRPDSFPNIEQFLSEMQANEQLFDSSRPATGGFTSAILAERRQGLLLELAGWFHEIQAKALKKPPVWLKNIVKSMEDENAQIISFNWDLILDQLIFGDGLNEESYGLVDSIRWDQPRLLKPHGSLNWYEHSTGRHLHDAKCFTLPGTSADPVRAFKPFRAPRSDKRTYMPLIVPPVFNKDFQGALFQTLWQEAVLVLSHASEVRFLGYSLPVADFHARFILRCGFHNQENGALLEDGTRATPTGRAKVVIVDPSDASRERVEDAVGWSCEHHATNIENWVLAAP